MNHLNEEQLIASMIQRAKARKMEKPALRTLWKHTLQVEIPVLSIQPLVENAVKHGVASRTGNGFVRLSIRSEAGLIRVRVSNSGEFDTRTPAGSAPGIGLANVRRRLALCYGEATRVEVDVADGVTTVGFALPVKRPSEISVTV